MQADSALPIDLDLGEMSMVGQFKPLRYRKRWFCYLDLLGFTALVNDNDIRKVIPTYQDVLNKLKTKVKVLSAKGVIYSWFSDTFIIYSRSDSEEEFALIEAIGRQFFQELILRKIPVRGAITHGPLYSQSSKNIFVGQALIDAYNYGEKQEWIGFILTPKVFEHLALSSIPLHERAHYRRVTRTGVLMHEPSDPIYAFAFNNDPRKGENPYILALQEMRALAPEKAHRKYDNAIAFAKQHARNEITGKYAT